MVRKSEYLGSIALGSRKKNTGYGWRAFLVGKAYLGHPTGNQWEFSWLSATGGR